MKEISLTVKHYHVELTRWKTGEVVSVTIAPSGYIIDAHVPASGWSVELLEDEIRFILYNLGIDPD